MHIGIFAERFIGRYGADRVLVILAELLRQQGHQVTLIGVRFSQAVLDRFPQATITVPVPFGSLMEKRALKYLQDTHYFRRRHLPEFDACVVGGYPFISTIPYLRTLARQVIFIDFGVVPTFGYARPLAQLIASLRTSRQQHLRHATHIVAISDFIARDQSRPDCADKVPVSTVLLGADHQVTSLGCTEQDPIRPGQKSYTQDTLEKLRKREQKLVLVLGRWEPDCYKNSRAAFDVLRGLIHYGPDVGLLIMANPQHFGFEPAEGNPNYFSVDPALANNVFCIGLPSDADLLEVTRTVDAGISVSLWEGFNLPVVEMQYLEKHAFAFELAAHPEVVVSSDQLCADAEDMAIKLLRAVDGGGRPAWAEPAILAPWREKFSWQRFQKDFSRIVESAA